MKSQFFFCLMFSILLLSCEMATKTKTYNQEEADFIELKKDPCFGFCPVYKIKISGNGKAIYNGKKNVEKEGTWYRTLNLKQTNDLFAAFEVAGFWSMEDEYTAQVTDLPTTWTTLYLGEKSKTIKDYYGAPEKLKELEAMIEKIAEEEGWKREADPQ